MWPTLKTHPVIDPKRSVVYAFHLVFHYHDRTCDAKMHKKKYINGTIIILLSLLPWFARGQTPVLPGNMCTNGGGAQTVATNTPAPISLKTLSRQQVANLLGWIQAPGLNICNGYYTEPESISAFPNPSPIDTTQTTITASQPSLFSTSGTSILKGNVTVTQPGREVSSDEACLYRDDKTGKINRLDMNGNVHFREAGKLIVGNKAHLSLIDKTAVVENGFYHIARPTSNGTQDAWGWVKRAYRQSSGILDLFKASYTTCAPLTNTWDVKASHIELNKKTGRGQAFNARLHLGGIPVFYLPYFNFPIDKRRYSGFLLPTFGSSVSNGFDLTTPFYLNLAPNYDDTLLPRVLTKRGVQMGNWFRYLTQSSQGQLQVFYLPNDVAFKNFQNTAVNQYPPNQVNTPFLNQLHSDSDDRGYFAYQDSTVFNPNWSTSLQLNYATDDYYFQDLGSTPYTANLDQLINDWDINYQSEHWRFLARAQAYQTLHLINQAFVADQYRRVPQLDLTGDYPDVNGVDYHFDSEFVQFDHANDFFLNTPYPTGGRIHFDPSVDIPIIRTAGFFIPQLQIDLTQYNLVNNDGQFATSLTPVISNNTVIGPPFINEPDHISRALPLFDIDSGLYFDRYSQLFGHAYHQTLEPRLFYLFVPEHTQTDIPIFDTSLPPYGFNQLFQANRFAGYDRIGDANQVAAGVTTRFFDGYTGADKLDVSVGEGYLFHKHTVCLFVNCQDDPSINDQITPIVSQMTYNLTPHWNASAQDAWDPNSNQDINHSISLQYQPLPRHVVNLSYNFVTNGDSINPSNPASSQNNLNRVDVSFAWPVPVVNHWSALADWNYNVSHGHSQTYLYGLEYDSCCFAVRLLTSHTLIAEDINGNTNFSTNYYVQFQLKGLGNIGNSDPGALLMSLIPGYQDTFSS